MQSYYSWYGTRIHLLLDDEMAEGYNRVLAEFYSAQVRHREQYGRDWNPKTEPLLMDLDDKDKAAFNSVCNMINKRIKERGGLDIPDEELTEEGLKKLY